MGALALITAQQLSAVMLVDRGLPTHNLNNAAGASRSNVAWLFGGYTPTDYWLVGDSFQNTSSNSWTIDTITLWSMKETDTASLWGGIVGSSIGIVSSNPKISDANYADSSTYQGSQGGDRAMHQIDFPVNITLAPGQVYDFFFDGRSSDSGYTLAYAHASNAALSGSPQEGSDNWMRAMQVVNGAAGVTESWTSLGNGWDKASDINVRVTGTVPDGGTTLVLLGCAVTGLGALRRKFVA